MAGRIAWIGLRAAAPDAFAVAGRFHPDRPLNNQAAHDAVTGDPIAAVVYVSSALGVYYAANGLQFSGGYIES